MANLFKQQVGYAVGTGRCGTNFLAKVIKHEPGVASTHERNALNETFHRYCKWNSLPVDYKGFLQAKKREIELDLKDKTFSFESSAHLSLSLQELYQAFDAKFVFIVRSPEKVVNSYYRKGFYNRDIYRQDVDLALGYQQEKYFHHFLGRIVPNGVEFDTWNKMGRVGKIAWYWKTINEEVLRQFETIPEDNWLIVKLEDFDYQKYVQVTEFLGIKSVMTQHKYEKISGRRPNSLPNIPNISKWNEQDIDEFEKEVASISELFGYAYKISEIPKGPVTRNKSYIDPIISPIRSKIKARLIEMLKPMI